MRIAIALAALLLCPPVCAERVILYAQGELQREIEWQAERFGRVELPPNATLITYPFTLKRINNIEVVGNRTTITTEKHSAPWLMRVAQCSRLRFRGVTFSAPCDLVAFHDWPGRATYKNTFEHCAFRGRQKQSDGVVFGRRAGEATCADTHFTECEFRDLRSAVVQNNQQSVNVHAANCFFYHCDRAWLQRAGGLSVMHLCYFQRVRTLFAAEGRYAGGSSNQPSITLRDCKCDDDNGPARILDLSRLSGGRQFVAVVDNLKCNVPNNSGEGFDLFRVSPVHRHTSIDAARLTKTGRANVAPVVWEGN